MGKPETVEVPGEAIVATEADRKLAMSIAQFTMQHADRLDAHAALASSPFLKAFLEESSMIQTSLGWALKEVAESGNISALESLSDAVSNWLMDRQVGIPGLEGVSIGQLAKGPNAN